MSTISAVNSTIGTDSTEKSQGTDLTLSDFYNLLITEIKNQDPTDPVDNKELVLQMAQFSSYEASMELNNNMSSYIESSQLSTASGMIGKTVTYLDGDNKTCTGVVSSAVNLDDGYGVELADGTSVKLNSISHVYNTTSTAEE